MASAVYGELRGGVRARVGIQGGYTGWVGGGLYRVPSQLPGRGPQTAERAPEAPSRGLEWVVCGARA